MIKENFNYDYFRVTGKKPNCFMGGEKLMVDPVLRFLFLFRVLNHWRHERKTILYYILYPYYRYLKYKLNMELEIGTQVGRGLLIVHRGGIKVNPKAVIGDNCTLFSGCVIGSIRGGKRAGAPILGNAVYVGVNAAVVGGIRIGDDVVIAPNSFVNYNVPSHSVCVGNPAIIRHKDEATKYYCFNKVNFYDGTKL